ncbi:family 1 glycosylhydrolase [Thermobacillus sp. ZCTH02-B1]|uniref:family 1 glycosylhydrolase n=1 Tax=Thermobacillus sp. ZCTH02-B1 TaxID=1858795 RepID=UPI0025E3108F|nr:family 1 glycosylhydrolase [Thermobacillus sp. ZCTH02-B1]
MAIWGSYRVRPKLSGARVRREDAAGTVSEIWNRHVVVFDGGGLPLPEDVALLAAMGYRAFQFELLWPAVLHADGSPNEEGIRRCRGLVGTIRQYGMTPIISACRWQRPLWMRIGGRWVNVKSNERYRLFMNILHSRLGSDAIIRNRPHEPWDAAARELKWFRAFSRDPAGAMASRYRIGTEGESLA